MAPAGEDGEDGAQRGWRALYSTPLFRAHLAQSLVINLVVNIGGELGGLSNWGQASIPRVPLLSPAPHANVSATWDLLTSLFICGTVLTAGGGLQARRAVRGELARPPLLGRCCRRWAAAELRVAPMTGGRRSLGLATMAIERPWLRGLATGLVCSSVCSLLFLLALGGLLRVHDLDGLGWALGKSLAVAAYGAALFTLSWRAQLLLAFETGDFAEDGPASGLLTSHHSFSDSDPSDDEPILIFA